MKEVRVCEAMKSPVGTLSDGTVLHQQDGGTKSRQVPIWEKSNLTLEEAAAYSGIGINKLREMSDSKDCTFVLWNGTKRLLKLHFSVPHQSQGIPLLQVYLLNIQKPPPR